MTVKELRQLTNMNMTDFSAYFGIPFRTYQNWERGTRNCPPYLLALMQYKLEKENIISVDAEK